MLGSKTSISRTSLKKGCQFPLQAWGLAEKSKFEIIENKVIKTHDIKKKIDRDVLEFFTGKEDHLRE